MTTQHFYQAGLIEDRCRIISSLKPMAECGLPKADPTHYSEDVPPPSSAQEGPGRKTLTEIFSSFVPKGNDPLPDRERYTTFTGTLAVDDPPSTMQGAIIFFDQCVELMDQKNLNYGDAWRSQGYMGNLARILSKVSRLRNMLWRSDPTDQVPDQPAVMEGSAQADMDAETVRDTLMDLSNLCYFMARNLGEGNQWGRPE